MTVSSDGTIEDHVTGLPSAGDHFNNEMAEGPDGKFISGRENRRTRALSD